LISIPLSTEDLTRVRLAPSPLWETVSSLAGLLHHGRHTVHAPWATRTRRVLPGTDLSPLVAAMCLERTCPDFLSPPPESSVEGFGEELERLRGTPPEVVFEEVETLLRVEKELFCGLHPEQERLLGIFSGFSACSSLRLSLFSTLRPCGLRFQHVPFGDLSARFGPFQGPRFSARRFAPCQFLRCLSACCGIDHFQNCCMTAPVKR
jgi:hypothetical protein